MLLFALYGVWLKLRRPELGGLPTPPWLLDGCLVAIVVLHWVSISSFPVWWAGHSVGPRFFSDVTPYFIYFLIPVLPAIAASPPRTRLALSGLFAGALLVSVFFHYRGANDFAVYAWNADPIDPGYRTERIWDLRDIPYLRGLR